MGLLATFEGLESWMGYFCFHFGFVSKGNCWGKNQLRLRLPTVSPPHKAFCPVFNVRFSEPTLRFSEPRNLGFQWLIQAKRLNLSFSPSLPPSWLSLPIGSLLYLCCGDTSDKQGKVLILSKSQAIPLT